MRAHHGRHRGVVRRAAARRDVDPPRSVGAPHRAHDDAGAERAASAGTRATPRPSATNAERRRSRSRGTRRGREAGLGRQASSSIARHAVPGGVAIHAPPAQRRQRQRPSATARWPSPGRRAAGPRRGPRAASRAARRVGRRTSSWHDREVDVAHAQRGQARLRLELRRAERRAAGGARAAGRARAPAAPAGARERGDLHVPATALGGRLELGLGRLELVEDALRARRRAVARPR